MFPKHARLTPWQAVLLACLVMLSWSALAQTPAGQVMFVHGSASIERGDERIPAERGAEFYAGDTFHTEPASTLQLRFTDGGTQAIRPDSSFTLDRYELASEAPEDSVKQGELIRGGLRAITGAIGSNAPDNVTYKTPVATMGIRGTSFQLLHYPEDVGDGAPETGTGSYLYVETGLLEMSSDVGDRLVRPGQVFLTVTPDSPPQFVPGGVEIFEQLDEALPPAEDGNTDTDGAPPTPAAQGNLPPTPETPIAGTAGGIDAPAPDGIDGLGVDEITDIQAESDVRQESVSLENDADIEIENQEEDVVIEDQGGSTEVEDDAGDDGGDTIKIGPNDGVEGPGFNDVSPFD